MLQIKAIAVLTLGYRNINIYSVYIFLVYNMQLHNFGKSKFIIHDLGEMESSQPKLDVQIKCMGT